MNEERIRRIGMCNSSRNEFVGVAERRKWVKHIESKTKGSNLSKKKEKEAIGWAEEKKFAYETLMKRIRKHTRDKSKRKTNEKKRT